MVAAIKAQCRSACSKNFIVVSRFNGLPSRVASLSFFGSCSTHYDLGLARAGFLKPTFDTATQGEQIIHFVIEPGDTAPPIVGGPHTYAVFITDQVKKDSMRKMSKNIHSKVK
jgi:hypothetical protein